MSYLPATVVRLKKDMRVCVCVCDYIQRDTYYVKV